MNDELIDNLYYQVECALRGVNRLNREVEFLAEALGVELPVMSKEEFEVLDFSEFREAYREVADEIWSLEAKYVSD
jgi:hypothetical protein